MKNKIVKLFCVLIIFSSCHKAFYVYQLESPNPCSYIFNSPIDTIHDLINRNICGYQFYTMNCESKSTKIFLNGRAERLIKRNEDDFYLHSYNDPFKPSALYVDSSKVGYPYVAEFYIHLTAIDSFSTSVSIKTFNSVIAIGHSIIPNFHNGGYLGGSKKVPPSTIEEYEILLRIGKALGVESQMPKLVLPR